MIIVHITALAQALGVHRNTIRNWMKSGRIRARSAPGKGILFSRKDFDDFCQAFRLEPEHLVFKELSLPLVPATVDAAPEEGLNHVPSTSR